MDIKPIETVYKGYRFRSRLEARWAVFFDAAGVRWEYEKEGFELSNGERYLPDFWLPNNGIWVEVKGEDPDFKYRRMLERFSSEIDQPLLIAKGLPSDYNTELLCWDIADSSAGGPHPWDVHMVTVSKGVIHFGTTELKITDERSLYADPIFQHEIEVLRLLAVSYTHLTLPTKA